MTNRDGTGVASDRPRQDDRELLAACLQGDAAAWEALLVRYQRLIYSIPIKMGLSPNDAADVFQSVCMKLIENLPTLRNQEKINSWLTVTTRRECWRIAALRRREQVIVPYDIGDGSEGLFEVASADMPLDEQQRLLEQQQILRDALAALPERCRELLTLLFYHDGDLSYVEIARRMNMPRSSMGPTRARCLAKLKKLLEGKI
ncbi:MAG TPA: sigma-70 family RNA polymerase sigma factor [Blastocatellia bacterium]|nr:sigma-70 family RNA polymerase sigma factor [Blastocatellia bacterium]